MFWSKEGQLYQLMREVIVLLYTALGWPHLEYTVLSFGLLGEVVMALSLPEFKKRLDDTFRHRA